MSEKTQFQKIISQIRLDIGLLRGSMFNELNMKTNPVDFTVNENIATWIFDVYLDKLYEVNFKIVHMFEEFGLQNVNLPLEPVESNLKFIACGGLNQNYIKIDRLARALNSYSLEVDKALNSVRKYMYSTKWAKMKEIQPEQYSKQTRSNTHDYDCFVCHASEDKEPLVNGLVDKLRMKGYKIWYDEFTLTLGDSLREKIDHGLLNSRFGIVILSKAFFAKDWPKKELDGLVAREIEGTKVILPVWHGVKKGDVIKFSPSLAGRLAVSTEKGLDVVVEQISRVIQ